MHTLNQHVSGHFNLLDTMRMSSAKLAHDDVEAFFGSMSAIGKEFNDLHNKRQTLNWGAIASLLQDTMKEIIGQREDQRINSHDLITLHERLNTMHRDSGYSSITCSDACQVALDLAIKAQYRSSSDANNDAFDMPAVQAA